MFWDFQQLTDEYDRVCALSGDEQGDALIALQLRALAVQNRYAKTGVFHRGIEALQKRVADHVALLPRTDADKSCASLTGTRREQVKIFCDINSGAVHIFLKGKRVAIVEKSAIEPALWKCLNLMAIQDGKFTPDSGNVRKIRCDRNKDFRALIKKIGLGDIHWQLIDSQNTARIKQVSESEDNTRPLTDDNGEEHYDNNTIRELKNKELMSEYISRTAQRA